MHAPPVRLFEHVPDWLGTRVRFALAEATRGHTALRFSHRGWTSATSHYRGSSYCWALYLRLLRRAVELGDVTPYDRRLDA